MPRDLFILSCSDKNDPRIQKLSKHDHNYEFTKVFQFVFFSTGNIDWSQDGLIMSPPVIKGQDQVLAHAKSGLESKTSLKTSNTSAYKPSIMLNTLPRTTEFWTLVN